MGVSGLTTFVKYKLIGGYISINILDEIAKFKS